MPYIPINRLLEMFSGDVYGLMMFIVLGLLAIPMLVVLYVINIKAGKGNTALPSQLLSIEMRLVGIVMFIAGAHFAIQTASMQNGLILSLLICGAVAAVIGFLVRPTSPLQSCAHFDRKFYGVMTVVFALAFAWQVKTLLPNFYSEEAWQYVLPALIYFALMWVMAILSAKADRNEKDEATANVS
ncbi:MAG: hypothetical protein H8D86_00545 [Planctomycetes bacterium]|nr:hypothetical protein [Planctomycetota bacterium]